MNAPVKIEVEKINWQSCNHWSGDLPYRAVVPVKRHAVNGPILYQVAGLTGNPQGAEKSLRAAMKLHGGTCFYCPKYFAPNESGWTIDHVEPQALGGPATMHNFVVACQPCNLAKGHQPIDSFHPTATKVWLEALAKQLEERYSRLK